MKTKKQESKHPKKKKKWSASVTKHSNALGLKKNVFQYSSSHRIAESLHDSARKSKRRKGTVLQSAMSMLNFYINRAGKNLSETRLKILERAKVELRKISQKNRQHEL